jgi:hypothetical protein
MRITIHLSDDLFAKVRRLSAETHRTFTSLVEEALRESLARRATSGRSGPAKLPVFDGDGLLRGVDLNDSSALLDQMEMREDPR